MLNPVFLGYILPELPINPRVGIVLKGAFRSDHYTNNTNFLFVYVQLLYLNDPSNDTNLNQDTISYTENITDIQKIPLVDGDEIDQATESKRALVFSVGEAAYDTVHSQKAQFRVRMKTNIPANLPIQFAYNTSPIDTDAGVIYAACVLLGLYVMIIWEVVHRTFAAILASTMAIGILAAMNDRPTMSDVMSWIDVETLLLLFGMMILVAILSETGIFDYLAVYAYKVSQLIENVSWVVF